MMIDFTKCTEVHNNYGGSEKKKKIQYNDKYYMLKVPDPIREKNVNISYINNAICEYVGSSIYKLLEIPVQNVILGKYTNDKKIVKDVCACEDFTNGYKLYELKTLLLSDDSSLYNEMKLEDITKALTSKLIDNHPDAINRFWDMFIVDVLICNPDRHLGNIAFLEDENNKLHISPVYDCGSSLFPLLSIEEIEELNDTELKNKVYNNCSCYKIDNKKINTSKFILSLENKDCNEAILRIVKRIDIDKINQFLNDLPISKTYIEFYKNIINISYNEILYKAYKKLIK